MSDTTTRAMTRMVATKRAIRPRSLYRPTFSMISPTIPNRNEPTKLASTVWVNESSISRLVARGVAVLVAEP